MSLTLCDTGATLTAPDLAALPALFRAYVKEQLADPGPLPADGDFHGFQTPGDAVSEKDGRRAGYVCLDPTRLIGVFGSHRPGECPPTVIEFDVAGLPRPDEAAHKMLLDALTARKAEGYRKAQERAQSAWNASHADLQGHAYLVARGVLDVAHGQVRRHSSGSLVIPMRDAASMIWNRQAIAADGRKRFLDEGRLDGLGLWIPDAPMDGGDWYVVEGFAKALAVHAATGRPTLCAFTAGNLVACLREFQAAGPSRCIIAADNDQAGKIAAQTARAAFPMARALYPPDGAGDWNDVLLQRGREALAVLLKPDRLEPDPLRREPPPAEPYPLEALGPILGPAVLSLRRIVQAPPAMISQSLLAAAALCVQPHANLRIDGRTSPLTIFAITVGASGERKTAIDSLALKPIADRQRELVAQYRDGDRLHKREIKEFERIEREAIKEKVVDLTAIQAGRQKKQDAVDQLGEPPQPPLLPNILAADPTSEGLYKLLANGQPSLGLFSDEGGLFVGGAALLRETRLRTIAVLSKLWDGRPLDRVRSGDGASVLFDRRLSLHLMMQPLVAAELFNDPIYADQGFLSRVLCAWPDSTAGTRRYVCEDATQDPAVVRYWSVLKALLERPYPLREGTRNELTPRNLSLAGPAKAVWIRYSDAIEEQLADGQPLEPIRGFANKAAEHAARIAGVLAMIENPDTVVIDLPHVQAGIALLDFYLTEILRIQDSGAGSPDLRMAERLLLWARDKDSVHLRQICQYGPNGIRDSETARRIAGILERHRWFIKQPDGVVVDGIRHREAWTVWRPSI